MSATGDQDRVRARTVRSGSSSLAVYERGPSGGRAPTIVLAHGWPDSAALWDPVADRLAERFHVVTFDARGVGRSTPAAGRRPYALGRMADDIDAVAAATGGGRAVHLVGHDWGSVAMWEYVGDPGRDPRALSFTSISGPCLDHLGHSFRTRLRRPGPSRVAPVLSQLARSSYVVYQHLPVASTVIWRLGFERLFRRWLLLTEGIPVDGDHPAPTVAADAVASVPLYRTNVLPRLVRPAIRRTDRPVQLVVATRDRYVSPRLLDDVARWAPDLRRHDVEAGHWSPRTHPDLVADLVAAHVDAVEAARPAAVGTR